MKSVVVDKIASVAQHNDLASELRLSKDIPCEEGVLVAARVLNSKSRYNQLELTSGRMATVTAGDIVVGALGHRNALRGYSGRLPESLAVGDTVQLLNIGGVLGICDSANPDVGAPFDCEVLGNAAGWGGGLTVRSGSRTSIFASRFQANRALTAPGLGGAVASHLASQVRPGAVVIESTFTSIRNLARELYPRLPHWGLDRIRFDNARRIGDIDVPLLLVHSTEDQVIGFHHGETLASLAHPEHRIVAIHIAVGALVP